MQIGLVPVRIHLEALQRVAQRQRMGLVLEMTESAVAERLGIVGHQLQRLGIQLDGLVEFVAPKRVVAHVLELLGHRGFF